ncbi:hypothetical protein ACN27J_25955 [Solwaraspora sp. WMMB762]|uniref:hypothetical protein n=1 Tax=Solwaraspora sp. WMMB762 TaxID=3404120 RepID=UPI003B95FAB7
MKAFLPWLVVLSLVILLNAVGLRPLATALALGWLVYCIWTWVRPGSRSQG